MIQWEENTRLQGVHRGLSTKETGRDVVTILFVWFNSVILTVPYLSNLREGKTDLDQNKISRAQIYVQLLKKKV